MYIFKELNKELMKKKSYSRIPTKRWRTNDNLYKQKIYIKVKIVEITVNKKRKRKNPHKEKNDNKMMNMFLMIKIQT